MANGTGRAEKETVHSADKSNVISPEDINTLDTERKDKYLKRLKKENEEGKKAFVRVDQWLVVEGKKVLRKERNAAGSEYTHYLFNRERYVDEYKQIERRGGYELTNPDTGKTVFLPLKTVNGKDFKSRSTKG